MLSLRGNFSAPNTAVANEQYDIPEIGCDEVLIKVRACYISLEEEKRYHQLLSTSLNSCSLGRDVAGDIIKVGSNVESLREGMAVAGFVSYDFQLGGCGEMCICNQFDVVEKPSGVSYEVAAASVGTGLSAYTAVHYQGHVTAGDTVLVMDGGTPRGSFTVQVAQGFGAKVLSTYKTEGEKQILENMKPPVAQIIELTQRSNILASSIMEETGGIGVDCIVDNGVRLFTNEDDKDLMVERSMKSVPHKQEIISSLGFSGKWITSQPNLQLDPPDSQQLFLRGSSISFLFPPAWCLMRAQHGRFLHILKDVLERVQNGDFRCNEIKSIPLTDASRDLIQPDQDTTKCMVVVT